MWIPCVVKKFLNCGAMQMTTVKNLFGDYGVCLKALKSKAVV